MSKQPKLDSTNPLASGEAEDLYSEFVALYYGGRNAARLTEVRKRLEGVLVSSSEYSSSIRGEEVRSLLAESRGQINKAIRSREAEIRKILELHVLSFNTPSWAYVSRQYGFGELSDRLDLLAILYDKAGDTDRAIQVLLESKQYCESHQIAFDAQDVLDELQQARAAAGRGVTKKPAAPRAVSNRTKKSLSVERRPANSGRLSKKAANRV